MNLRDVYLRYHGRVALHLLRWELDWNRGADNDFVVGDPVGELCVLDLLIVLEDRYFIQLYCRTLLIKPERSQ